MAIGQESMNLAWGSTFYHIYIFSVIWTPSLDAVLNMFSLISYLWSNVASYMLKRMLNESIVIYLNDLLIVARLCIALVYVFWNTMV